MLQPYRNTHQTRGNAGQLTLLGRQAAMGGRGRMDNRSLRIAKIAVNDIGAVASINRQAASCPPWSSKDRTPPKALLLAPGR